jgi:hypothetical protein
LDEILTKYEKNQETFSIIKNLNQYPKFEWKNDILWYKGRSYLNTNSIFKAKVLQECHDCPTTGHVGFFKTYYNARRSFFWKWMSEDIRKYVAECDLCQRKKNEMCQPLGYSTHYTFPIKNGNKFQWISLNDYPYPMDMIKY